MVAPNATPGDQKPAGFNPGHIRYIVLAVIVVMLAVTLGPKAVRKIREQRLLSNGIKANAEIVDLDETGNYVNREPELLIKVKVTPAEGEPFEAEVRKVLGPVDLKRYDVGTKVDVRYDPDNTDHVAIVGLTRGQ
jgi:hypothetical protein